VTYKFLISLAFLPIVVNATDWTKLGLGDSDVSTYVDYSSLKVNGNMRRVWLLIDRRTPHENGWLSAKVFREIDCQEDQTRIVSFITFTGEMGKGAVVSSAEGQKGWRSIAPETANSALERAICSEPTNEKHN